MAATGPEGTFDLDAGFRLGDLVVEPQRSRILRADGEEQRLEPRAMAALVHLARTSNTIGRDELIDAVWQTTVSDEVVSRAISLIRQALGDSARSPRFVETVPKIGYRLLVPPAPLHADPVEPLHPSPAEPSLPPAGEPRRTLRAVGFALAGSLALIAMALLLGNPFRAREDTTIAILPLQDQVQASTSGPIGLGLADALRTELGRTGGLRVLARSSSMAIAREAADAREIGERFGIDVMLEGSVIQTGDRVVVQLSLSDADEGLQRWAQTFEGHPDALFELGNDIVAAVRKELRGERAAVTRPSPNSPAYTAYLQGLHHMALRGAEELERAEALFRTAIAADDAFDPARVALARTLALKPYWSAVPEADVFPRALAILDAIESTDPTVQGVAAGVRGFIAFRSWAWADAQTHFAQAVRDAPQDAGIRAWNAQYLAALGDAEGSLREALEAWDLDPGSPIVGTRVAAAYLWNDDPMRAADFYDTSDPLALAVRDPSYLIWLLETGRSDALGELIAAMHVRAELDAHWVDACITLVTATGDRNAALSRFDDAIAAGQVAPRMLLPVRILAGEYERAADMLAANRNARQLFEVEFLFSPQAKGFRASPAFARSLETLGHPALASR